MEIFEKICREMHDQACRQDGVKSIRTVIIFDDGNDFIAETGRLDVGSAIKLEQGDAEPLA